MDDKAVVALWVAFIGQALLGGFNALTMRTRTRADIESAVINAGVASEKNDIEEGNAAVAQWRGLYDAMKLERDEALKRVKELEARPQVPTVIVEKAQQVTAGQGIEL